MNKKQFSDFISKKRDKTGLTQFDFGTELGVSWVTIWRWENEDSMPKPDAIDYWIEKVNAL